MSRDLPYFRWYPADAETDNLYASLNDSELGFYHRCLNRAWINGGIPQDLNELASLFHRKPKQLEKVWGKVSKCFVPSKDNPLILINARQEKERSYAKTKSVRATDAVRSRYGRSTDEVPRGQAGAGSASASGSEVSSSGKESQRENRVLDAEPIEEIQHSVQAVTATAVIDQLDELLGVFVALGRGITFMEKMNIQGVWVGYTDTVRGMAYRYVMNSLDEWRTRPTDKIPFPANYFRDRHWERSTPRLIPQTMAKSKVESAHERAGRRFMEGR